MASWLSNDLGYSDTASWGRERKERWLGSPAHLLQVQGLLTQYEFWPSRVSGILESEYPTHLPQLGLWTAQASGTRLPGSQEVPATRVAVCCGPISKVGNLFFFFFFNSNPTAPHCVDHMRQTFWPGLTWIASSNLWHQLLLFFSNYHPNLLKMMF